MTNNAPWRIVALYKFIELNDLPSLQQDILALCKENGICGTLLLAPEGINGTVGGKGNALDHLLEGLNEMIGLDGGEVKFSHASEKPFNRMKVRLKKEIITMRAPEADPTKTVGTYVSPEEWNKIISDPEVVTLDTRNTYETKTGIFKHAIDPEIGIFTEFKDYVEQNLDPKKNKKIAMYCTGGIRCEKASSYMLAKGFEEVYHLKGGILKYLETIPADESLWEGECFVFDKRVTVGHGLAEGSYGLCFGCREPIDDEDMASPLYEQGVCCPACHDDLTEERAAARRMRHQHMNEKLLGEDNV